MALTNEISSLTNRYLIPKLVDNIFESNALLMRARKNDWYETSSDYGTSCDQPLLYATTSGAMRFYGSETLDTSDNQQMTAASWSWKQYSAPISITRIDELQNQGKNGIVNHLKSKVQAAEASLQSFLGTDLFGDGTTPKSIQGLRLLAAATGTYGSIDKSANSWWQGRTDTTTTAITTASLQSLFGDCTVDTDRPTLVCLTQDIFDDLYAALTPMQRFADDDTFNAGFQNLNYNGVPVLVDSHCPTGYLFAVNEKYLSFKVFKDENFRFAPFQRIGNQNARRAFVFWAGALTCSNCRMNGMMSALT